MAIWIFIEAICGLVLATEAVRHVNASSRTTWLPISLTWVALGGAGICVAWGGLRGDLPSDWRLALLMAAMAAFSIIDRRRRHGHDQG